MILVGERGAKERHDPVAHDLIHRAFVAVDGFHHVFEDGVEDLARLLGIAVSEQLHRALEVGEQHRDLFALAFQRGLRGKDAFCEMLRGVGVRRRETRGRGWRRRRDRLSAFKAELGVRRELSAAVGTTNRKRRRAFQTELCLGRICGPASRTVHGSFLKPTPSVLPHAGTPRAYVIDRLISP